MRDGRQHLVKLYNDFHNTEATVRYTIGNPLTRKQIARARRMLCGNAECKCHGSLGERGPQDVEILEFSTGTFLRSEQWFGLNPW